MQGFGVLTVLGFRVNLYRTLKEVELGAPVVIVLGSSKEASESNFWI